MTNKTKILTIWCCILFACHTPNTGPMQSITDSSVEMYNDTLHIDTTYKYINLIPDSLRTPEQKEFIRNLANVLVRYIKIENNHMILTLSRSQLIKKGIPSPYYDMIQKNLRDNNSFIDKNDIKNFDSMWQDLLLRVRDSID